MGHRNDWRLTTALFAITGLVESLAFGHLGAFTPLFIEQLGVPRPAVPVWTGVLSALGFVIGLPLLPFWGVWADRYGRKLIIIRSSVAGALMFGLAALSRDVYWLAAARFLSGFVLGNTGVMMAVQSEITPRHRLGTAVAIISAGAPVGMTLGPYLGGQMVEAVGIRPLLGLDSVLTILVAVMLGFLLHEEPRTVEVARSTWSGIAASLRAISHTPAVRTLFVVSFLLAFGMSMSQPYVPLIIQHAFRGPAPDLAPAIGAVLTLQGAIMAVTTPVWGPIGDRAGHLRALRVCAGATALILLEQGFARTVPEIRSWRAAQGAFQGGIGALTMVLLARYAPPSIRASVLTLSLFPQQVSWFVGPLTGSALAARSLSLPFWVGAGFAAAGSGASLALPAPHTAGDQPGGAEA